MSLLDKLKSMISGGSSADTDAHAGHDHSADDHDHGHTHEPAVLPPDPAAEDDRRPE